MKKIFILNIVIFHFLNIWGQEIDIASPQTSDFVRYGNLPVNQYTGELDLSIPLFNVKPYIRR